MTLAPYWRNRLFAAAAAPVAVWLGFDIAQGSYFWPACCAAALALFLLARWQPLPLSTLILGAVVAGYVIGNRGFAQVSLTPSFPLLPAETALLVAGAVLLVQCAWRHELPFVRDPLNYLLLTWMAVGALRIGFDVRQYGFMALRDFALVYYAAFFFLGQAAAREPASERFLERALLVSCAVLLPVYEIYKRVPDFFIGTLTLRGNPIIFFKDDLAGTFLAAGAVLVYLRWEHRSRWFAAAGSLVFAGAALATGNRASLLGLAAAAAWLAVGGRWRFAAVQAAGAAIAAAVVLAGATVLKIPWERTPVYGVYERVASVVDVSGSRIYESRDAENKGDNNLFRKVWWETVIADTLHGNPYIGLGFGTDLADRFVREYYPESGEEFSTRSPHNVLLTIFARMGALGLALFLAVLGTIGVYTWRAVHAGPAEAAPWCAAWTILVSACLGVVLEGPMGAVVFWILLGVANGSRRSRAAATAATPSPAPADAAAGPGGAP